MVKFQKKIPSRNKLRRYNGKLKNFKFTPVSDANEWNFF